VRADSLMLEIVKKIIRFPVRLAETVWFYIYTLWRKLFDDDIILLASGLAFNGILALIPLFLLVAAAFSAFLDSKELGVQHLENILNTTLPQQPFSEGIKQSILGLFSEISAHRTSLGIFGIAGLIWGATTLFTVLRKVLHKVFRIAPTKSLLKSMAQDVGFVFLAFLLFISSSFVIWFFFVIEHRAKGLLLVASIDLQDFNKTLPTAIFTAVTGCMFYIVYRFIPDSKPPKLACFISTIVATALWVASGKLLSIYLSDFSSVGAIYGPYAFIIVVLFWMYYSSIIFIFGGMFGEVYWRRDKMKNPPLKGR